MNSASNSESTTVFKNRLKVCCIHEFKPLPLPQFSPQLRRLVQIRAIRG